MESKRTRRWSGAAALAGVLALGACDVPTEAPILETRWVIPTDATTTIAVADVLPPDVIVENGEFVVQPDATESSRSLGDLCPECAAVSGLTVPKPAFTGELETVATLPDDVTRVTLTGGLVDLVLRNSFDFDPLRPGTETGTIQVEIENLQGTTLAAVTFDGTVDALPVGGTLERTIEIGNAPVAGVRVTATIDSPAGDPVVIELDGALDIVAEPREFRASSAIVQVNGEAFDVTADELDVEDIDSSVVDRIEGGAFAMDVTNPLGVSANLELRIAGPFPTIVKPLVIGSSPTSTTRIEFTGEELRRFLGQSGVTVGGAGTVQSSGDVTVTPTQEIELAIDVDLTLRIGG